MSSDTNDGTGSVIIKKKEVGHKNGSVYKKCNGNQPATKSFGMDVVSHTLEGKTKFAAYSFDVMFEKDGAERLLDLTTCNHMVEPATALMVSAAEPTVSVPPPNPNCTTMSKKLSDDRAAVQSKADNSEKAHTSQGLKKQLETGAISSAFTTPGSSVISASNSQILSNRLSRLNNGDYTTPTQKPYKAYEPVKSNACSKTLSHNTGRQSRHAEMNIINKIFATPQPPNVTITFAVNWPAGGDQAKANKPCNSCATFLKKVCACVGQINICNSKGQPRPMCPPKKGQKVD